MAFGRDAQARPSARPRSRVAADRRHSARRACCRPYTQRCRRAQSAPRAWVERTVSASLFQADRDAERTVEIGSDLVIRVAAGRIFPIAGKGVAVLVGAGADDLRGWCFWRLTIEPNPAHVAGSARKLQFVELLCLDVNRVTI